MTTPLQRRLHEDKALRYEKRAEQDVAAELVKRLRRVNQRAAKLYVRVAGGLDKPLSGAAESAVRGFLRLVLGALGVTVRPGLLRAAKGALQLGVDLATVQIGKKVVVNPRVDRQTMRVINQTDAKVKGDLEEAAKLLASMKLKEYADVLTVLAKANQAVHRVEATTRWVTNKAINTGSAVVSKAAGAREMWVHEHGACLTCLAYSGEISVGGMFPAGLTFGDSSTVPDPIDGPPAHPNCRCRKVPWLGSKAGVGPVEAPDALKREAQREVLRGSAQASEAARLRAADKLLKVGTALPKTAEKRAQQAVLAGKF